jgi:putative iron-dependent peroxidase
MEDRRRASVDTVDLSEPQAAINAPDTAAAIFLVLLIQPESESVRRVKQVCGTLDALVRAVAARDPMADLSGIVAFGSEAWEPLFGPTLPINLHAFRELRSGARHAPATPGDVLFHLRSHRQDMCFELAEQLILALGESVIPADEVHGFRYFDDRDLIGFVDGTENPTGSASIAATVVGEEDPAFAGGSYVIVQKYLHDLSKWRQLPTETQEEIIGRTKLDDIELADDVKPSFAHNALTKIVENGEEIPILRHNMPFGNVSGNDQGTFFIAYARSPRPIEQMMENMFIGDPPGNHDHLLDFTRPVTGTNFFAPSQQLLAVLAAGTPVRTDAVAPAASESPVARRAGMLEIGSLKGVPQNE